MTLSTYQKNSWFDLLAAGMRSALDSMFSADVELRRGLPVRYLTRLGLPYEDEAAADGSRSAGEWRSGQLCRSHCVRDR